MATVAVAGGMVVLAGCGGSPPLFPAHETATEKNCIAGFDGRAFVGMGGNFAKKMESDWAKRSTAAKRDLVKFCMTGHT